ncbi:MAG: hypothetical protein ACPGXZ_11825 [Saprospiraceae bacterium]
MNLVGDLKKLCTKSYEQVLARSSFRISKARNAIEIVDDIRHKTPLGLKEDYHPLASLPLVSHSFRE